MTSLIRLYIQGLKPQAENSDKLSVSSDDWQLTIAREGDYNVTDEAACQINSDIWRLVSSVPLANGKKLEIEVLNCQQLKKQF
jgi:hypothetical protein